MIEAEASEGVVVSRVTEFESALVDWLFAASLTQTDKTLAFSVAVTLKLVGRVPAVQVQPPTTVEFSLIQ